MNDTIGATPLMSVPIIIDPDDFGFIDYSQLISLCYEVRGPPNQVVNLVSTKCTSINGRYANIDESGADTTFGVVGVRTVDASGACNNIQVEQDCSVHYNKEILSSNFTGNAISIEIYNNKSNSVHVSIPNCGKEIVMHFNCQHLLLTNTPVMDVTFTRNYLEQDITHGLIGISLKRSTHYIHMQYSFYYVKSSHI